MILAGWWVSFFKINNFSIIPFNLVKRYFFSSYYIPGTLIGLREAKMSRTQSLPSRNSLRDECSRQASNPTDDQEMCFL